MRILKIVILLIGTDVEKLYQNLSAIPKMHVYRKCDANLTKLHYCKNRRIMQFVLEAEEGYYIGNTDTLKYISSKEVLFYNGFERVLQNRLRIKAQNNKE